MSKVQNENYVVIQGWMLNELQLKGNELIVYAIIYGFTQIEGQLFNGSLQYLADWTNSTKQGVLKNLKSLIEKGYIKKNDKYINSVKFCEYYTTKLNEVYNKVDEGIQQSLIPPIKQSLTNNINLNTSINNNNDNKVPYEKIKDLFHEICISYPKVIKLSDNRKKTIKARYIEYGKDIEIFKTLFTKAEESNFLKGKNDSNWSASFDWLINSSNMIKILEGNYDNKEGNKQTTRKEIVPEWMNKEIKYKPASPEAQKRLEDLIKRCK